MTDEQMIIDGVDVSGCEFCDWKGSNIPQCRIRLASFETTCKGYNCYYKQLKRKEQENKRLLEIINAKPLETVDIDSAFEIEKLKEQLQTKEQECERWKKANDEKNELLTKLGCPTMATAKRKVFCLQEQLDKLKEKKEKMSKGYAELTEIVSPYIDDFTGYNEKLGGFDIVLCVKELLQQFKTENEKLKEENFTFEQLIKWYEKYGAIEEIVQQLNQLKAENEKYSFFIEKLCDYIGLECDSEEQAMRTLSDFARQMNKARWIIDRYKQTLVEINEIAKQFCNACQEFEPEKRGSNCIYCNYGKILQKIKECEVENAR